MATKKIERTESMSEEEKQTSADDRLTALENQNKALMALVATLTDKAGSFQTAIKRIDENTAPPALDPTKAQLIRIPGVDVGAVARKNAIVEFRDLRSGDQGRPITPKQLLEQKRWEYWMGQLKHWHTRIPPRTELE